MAIADKLGFFDIAAKMMAQDHYPSPVSERHKEPITAELAAYRKKRKRKNRISNQSRRMNRK